MLHRQLGQDGNRDRRRAVKSARMQIYRMNFDRSASLARSPTLAADVVARRSSTVSPRAVGGGEADLVEQLLHHRLQAPRADVLDARVDLGGEVGERVDGVVGEVERHALGRHQRHVLLDQAGLGLGQDAARSRRASAPCSSTRIGRRPCSSGSRSDGLATWKAPEAMNRMWSVLHRAVLGGDGRALDQRQQVALHALAADVGADALRRARDLVDLVEEDDAVVLDRRRCASRDDLVLVEQLVALLGDQQVVASRRPSCVARLVRWPKALPSMSPRLIMPICAPGMPGNVEGRHAAAGVARPRSRSPCRRARRSRSLRAEACRASSALAVCADQRVEHALLGVELGLGLHLLARRVAHQADADLDQVADDLLDVAADIADLGELGRLDLDERRARRAWPGGARSRSCRRRSGRSSGCSWAAPPRAGRRSSCWRRQRLRSAMATARLASFWPTM